MYKQSWTFRYLTSVQPALAYIINSHPYSVFHMPNSEFHTQLASKHFELSHSVLKVSPKPYCVSTKCQKGLSWRPCSLRCRSVATHLLRWQVLIPPRAWISVSCEWCVLSARGLCDRPITCLEKSYWAWCVYGRDYTWLLYTLLASEFSHQLMSKQQVNLPCPLHKGMKRLGSQLVAL